MNPTTTAKCACHYCNSLIEFDIDRAGESVTCPHCGMDTTLYRPLESIPQPKAPRKLNITFGKVVGAIALILLTIIVIVALLMFKQYPAEGWQLILGLIGMIVIGLLILLVFLWIVFPVFVFQKLTKANELLEEISRKLG